jgi:hypothetical protein
LLLAPKGLLNFYVAISGSVQKAAKQKFPVKFQPEAVEKMKLQRSEARFLLKFCAEIIACFAAVR